ncbi:YfhO family protein [Lutimonas sp.]|uniref:YfhO family protein n=1 Tax=Lutimonas sp. TaxID=1872403 RepID=UPI003D9B103C
MKKLTTSPHEEVKEKNESPINFRKYIPLLIALISFVIVSLAYFSPVLEGKELFQSDIAQFRGMSKEVNEYREAFEEEPYWTNRAFGGMPTYQLSTYYPNDYIKKLDSLLRFLPRPADYLFLYFLGFFLLLSVLKVDWKLAVIGALGFGFSTYLIIILGVGHNAKAHAIAYMPFVLSGVLLVFQKRWLLGFVLTALGMALEINASHPQMTYYLLFSVLIFGLIYLIQAVKEKELPDFAKKIGLLIVAVVLAVGVNATSLLATKEYAAHSTRSQSELTMNPDGSPKEISTGLSKSYITEYSFGLMETFDLFIPRFMGGSNNEKLDKDSFTYRYLKDKAGRKQALGFAENAPMYWGEQPIVAAPPYIGAIFIYLFVLATFLIKGPIKKWLVAATVFSIVLSWGKNLDIVTNFFIDYVPLYNKFRAVSSIQVIAEVSVPLLGILGIQHFLSDTYSKEEKMKAFKFAGLAVVGIALFFTAFGASLFSFESYRDGNYEQMLAGLADVLREDRRTIFFQDSLRTLVLVVVIAGLLWLYMENKIKRNVVIGGLLMLVLLDLVNIDKRYVNNDDFISKSRLEKPFELSQMQAEILKDKGHFRVMNFMVNPMNDGSTSFYHNSIGGYHAAKPRRYQELFDFQIAKNNIEVLNMLNTKYFVFPGENNIETVQYNEDANGNAWFVDEIQFVDTANEEIRSLDSLKTKTAVVINREFEAGFVDFNFEKDSLANISLTSYKANEISYESNSAIDQLAVFSEMYYKDGWNAYIDGKLVPHIRANYVLRALKIPAGKHEVVFKFEPQVIQTGNMISLISYGLLILLSVGWFFKERKDQKA